ncbi:hypothetical protein Sjap_025997 [Stephania japonica]|uniref:Uncharacterized protein n=1 Tax=Stephania japonica TaxID=461633 RepID=A0AAP0E2S5_9MAGN
MNPIALQRDVHQWPNKSSAFFESENAIERQRQLLPSQKLSSKASSTSINNVALTARTNIIDGVDQELNEMVNERMNPPMQRRSFNSVVAATQPSNLSMHHDSIPPSIHSGIPAPQPEMINALQPGSSLQLQQSAARSIAKISMNANQQAQINMVSQNGTIELQPKINLLSTSASLAKPHSTIIAHWDVGFPLLAESIATDNDQFSAPTNVSRESCKTEQPHERLLKVIKSIAPRAFSSSIGDADSVLCIVDTTDRSMQDNGCSMFFGESLVGATKHSSLSKRVMVDDKIVARKKMKCRSFAVQSNVVSSNGCIEDRQKLLDVHEIQDLGSTAESKVKHVMLEEIKEINRKLLTTVVEISDDDDKVISTCAAAQNGVGTIIRCSFSPMALCPDSKLHQASSQMPVLPVQLLVSTNYPNCSPVFLDNCLSIEQGVDVLFTKEKSWFTRSLRCLAQPMSIEEMAKSWDACAKAAAMKEYAREEWRRKLHQDMVLRKTV